MRYADPDSPRTPLDVRNIIARAAWAAKYHRTCGRDLQDLRDDSLRALHYSIQIKVKHLRRELWHKHLAKIRAERQRSLPALLRRQA